MKQQLISLILNNIKDSNQQKNLIGVVDYLPEHLQEEYYLLLNRLFSLNNTLSAHDLAAISQEEIKDQIEQLLDDFSVFSEKLDENEEQNIGGILSRLSKAVEEIDNEYINSAQQLASKYKSSQS